MKRTKTLTGLLALSLVLAACASGATGDPDRANPTGNGRSSTSKTVKAAGALVAFDACESFLDYVISHAVEIVGPYGLDGFPAMYYRDEANTLAGAEAAPNAASGDGSYSQTNVQVEGVDEPDMVKTDGKRIVLISEGELIVVDVTGAEPVETGRLKVADLSVQSLFLSGDRVLLFGSAWGSAVPLPAVADMGIVAPGAPTIRIVEVDISEEPEVTRTMTIDGSFVSGRMIDDTVRLVLRSGPVGFEWSYPSGSGLRAERKATEENQEIVRNSTPENWIPYYLVADADGDVVSEGTLFDCDRASRPAEFSGLDMLSVMTIDLSDGLEVIDSMGVLVTGDTVYASSDSLYVATQDWGAWSWLQTGETDDQPDTVTTDIHMFDISDEGITTYVATGAVEGYLLNQFAMDEHDGMLRVATTTTPNGWGSGPDSESRVSVLRPIGDEMVTIGKVDGLGLTEQIYSVRFLGDVAYVVTFRQTDPLYTIDLSNPRVPKVMGELKIPGYSAYLHPLGEDLVLGVGQDATDTGQVQGTQVSVFDVSDLTDPRRVDALTLGEGTSSQAEYDHHAFLYWDGLAVIPVQEWSWDGKSEDVFMGALGVQVDDSGNLTELDRIVHPGGEDKDWDYRAQIARTVVIDDSVYTISPKGLMKSTLDTLDTEAWLEF